MPGRAVVVKRAPVVEKEKPAKPWNIVLRDLWRKNKFACVTLGVIFVSWVAIMIFNRSSYIKSWAHSQGFTYNANYDYKFGRRFPYFDAVTRGQRSYAFNVMQGNVDYKNKSETEVAKTGVQAFDFCYTEVKTIQFNKRIQRTEKTLEFSAVVLDAFGYTFKSMIITPREMQVDSIGTDLPVQQADPDVEELLKGPQKDKDDDEDGDQAKDGNSTEGDKKNLTETKNSSEKGAPAIAAEDPTPDPVADALNETEAKPFNETHPLSAKFNETFKVEAVDHIQAAQIMSPALKQLLLDNPQFFVDFQEEQIMIYREYTIEAEEFTQALDLGKAVLTHLPNLLVVNATKPDSAKKKDAELDLSVFESKSEL